MMLDEHGNSYFFRWAKKKFKRVWSQELDLCASEGSRLLDAGCGEGGVFDLFVEKKVKHITGVDCLPNVLAMAQETVSRLPPGVEIKLVAADLENISALKSGSFDIVFSNGVVLMLKNPSAAIREMVRLVKDGGYIMVSATGKDSMYHRRFTRSGSFPGIDMYVAENQIRCFEECGATLIKKRPMIYFGYAGNTFPKGTIISGLAKYAPFCLDIIDGLCRMMSFSPSENMLILRKTR